MSAKLDKSLDEILVSRRQGARRRARRSAPNKAANAPVPVGGVKKTTKAAATKKAPAAKANTSKKAAPKKTTPKAVSFFTTQSMLPFIDIHIGPCCP